jgi:hypothetical protein
MNGFLDYKNYFKDTLIPTIPEVKDFVMGGSERILNRENSIINYPVVWLEIPDISWINDGGLKRRYSGAFVVLMSAPQDDWTREDADLDTTLTITNKILARMQYDAQDEGLFEFDIEGATTNHKGKWSGDNDWGWRTEFELIGDACECIDGDCFE